MRKFALALAIAAGAIWLGDSAQAASVNGMEQVYVCDPTVGEGRTNCLKPNADGSINTSGGGGGGGTVDIDQSTPGTTNGVVVNSSALPTGASTAALQTTGNGYLSNLDGAIGDPIPDCGTPANCPSVIGKVQITGATTGGATGTGYVSTASTNATNVKNAAGTVKAMNFINTTQTGGFVRMYNLASSPTCSSATGFVRSWPVPAGSASGLYGGLAASLPIEGTAFSTGISFCITGGGSSTDNTNAPAGIYFNIDYN